MLERPSSLVRQPQPYPQLPIQSNPLGSSYDLGNGSGHVPYTYAKLPLGGTSQSTKSALQTQVAQTLSKLTEQKYGMGGSNTIYAFGGNTSAS